MHLETSSGHVEYEYLTYTSPFVPAGLPDGSIIDPNDNLYKRGKRTIEFHSVFVGEGIRNLLADELSST